MGKYMRKGKGAGKIALMEVSQGALGVRTRAKTLAIEKDRKLQALARNVSPKQHNQRHSTPGCVESFQPSYLELRSRKLEKVRPSKSGLTKQQESSREDVGEMVEQESRGALVDTTECRRSSIAVLDVRTDLEDDLRREVVCSSRTPQLSPKPFEDFPFEVPADLNTPRTTPEDDAQLRCSEFGVPSEKLLQHHRVSSGGIVPSNRCCDVVGQTGVPSLVERPPVPYSTSQDFSQNARFSEAAGSCVYPVGCETGSSSFRKRQVLETVIVSASSENREGMDDMLPGSSTRLDAAQRQDRRLANHHRIMNRSYMRTNLFVDAEAIDELFAAPDVAERQEGRRFTERYNYDVVNDIPLKGRYEWVAAADLRSSPPPPTIPPQTPQQQQKQQP